jgi:hypothetical protein
VEGEGGEEGLREEDKVVGRRRELPAPIFIQREKTRRES